MANASNLVIVESPSKAKTIGKYLGPDYVVKASMGHLRDLPKSVMGVDLESFDPRYIPVKGKEAIISELKDAAKQVDTVYLATDPDREGEAISWHLKELLKLPEEDEKLAAIDEIVRQGMSVARTEQYIQSLLEEKAPKEKRPNVSAFIRNLTQSLSKIQLSGIPAVSSDGKRKMRSC
mgnify:CR=1 FL=1